MFSYFIQLIASRSKPRAAQKGENHKMPFSGMMDNIDRLISTICLFWNRRNGSWE